MEEVSNFWPAMAVPITVKIPEPMTAPIPSAVSDHGPRVFFSRFPGSSDSEISLSIDLHAKSWFARRVLPWMLESVPQDSNRKPRHWASAMFNLGYSLLYTTPPFITNFTRSSVVTSCNGSPSTAIMSA